MGLLKLLFNDPLAFAFVAVPLLYSVVIHEVAHGVLGTRFFIVAGGGGLAE